MLAIEGRIAYNVQMSKQESGIQTESAERFKQYPYLITISGHSGVGKTKTGEAIAERLGREYFKGGELMRRSHRSRTGNDIVGPTNRTVDEDIFLDRKLAKLIKNSSQRNPAIVESRLGALIAKGIIHATDKDGEVIEIPQTPGIVTVNITAGDENLRFGRLQSRYSKESGTKLPLDEVTRLTKEREKQDLELWMKAHPELRELDIQDPYDPNLKTPDGRRVYDIIIDTKDLSIEEATEELMRKLKEWGERYLSGKPKEQSIRANLPYFIG